jgi:DNA-binding winged helix-turn-helix (wHTH) protein/TolB-like protein/Flp pilus assembly protein TadD
LLGFAGPRRRRTAIFMNDLNKRHYEFGPFRLDAMKRRLQRNGEIVPLTPKAFDTLLALVESDGQVVEKDQLIEKVWPGVAVEENNLTQNISALRKAMDEKRDQPQYILTVPRVGYRFIADVRELSNAERVSPASAEPVAADYSAPVPAPTQKRLDGHRNWSRQRSVIAAALVGVVALAVVTYWVSKRVRGANHAASNAEIKSLAVLPFKPLSGGETDEYLGIGMADALITKLSSVKQISVRPTSSILRYADSNVDPSQAGRELGVNSLLEGHVQKSGDRIRVTLQLLRSSDGASLWVGKFDEKYTDIFAVEDRISEQVLQALLPTLTGSQKQQLAKHYTEDTEAYQSYIKGRYYWNKRDAEGITKAIGYFEDAILKDPNYALAYAGLADSYATFGVIEDRPSQELMPKARSAALRALELDDGMAEAHASLGYVKHRFEWDWAGAEKEFKRAIELNDDYAVAHQWYGWFLISEARFDEAAVQFKRAAQVEPLSLYANLTAGIPYFYAGQYDKAAAQYKKVIEMDTSFWLAHRWLGKTYERQGKYDEAIAEFQTVARGGNVGQSPSLACAYALAGKQTEARRVLAELLRTAKAKYVSPYSFAMIYATLGDKDQAFEWLEKDLKEHGDDLVFLRIEGRLDNLRSDPRFADLVRQVGIPQ